MIETIRTPKDSLAAAEAAHADAIDTHAGSIAAAATARQVAKDAEAAHALSLAKPAGVADDDTRTLASMLLRDRAAEAAKSTGSAVAEARQAVDAAEYMTMKARAAVIQEELAAAWAEGLAAQEALDASHAALTPQIERVRQADQRLVAAQQQAIQHNEFAVTDLEKRNTYAAKKRVAGYQPTVSISSRRLSPVNHAELVWVAGQERTIVYVPLALGHHRRV